jgi:hypothetical protein
MMFRAGLMRYPFSPTSMKESIMKKTFLPLLGVGAVSLGH